MLQSLWWDRAGGRGGGGGPRQAMGLLQHRAGVPPDAFCGGLALGKVKGGGKQGPGWQRPTHRAHLGARGGSQGSAQHQKAEARSNAAPDPPPCNTAAFSTMCKSSSRSQGHIHPKGCQEEPGDSKRRLL